MKKKKPTREQLFTVLSELREHVVSHPQINGFSDKGGCYFFWKSTAVVIAAIWIMSAIIYAVEGEIWNSPLQAWGAALTGLAFIVSSFYETKRERTLFEQRHLIWRAKDETPAHQWWPELPLWEKGDPIKVGPSQQEKDFAQADRRLAAGQKQAEKEPLLLVEDDWVLRHNKRLLEYQKAKKSLEKSFPVASTSSPGSKKMGPFILKTARTKSRKPTCIKSGPEPVIFA